MLSTLSGSGWNGTMFSGTSMATPMTAGTAALVLSAHPAWSPLKVKAAIVNTADAASDKIVDYDPLRAGSGVVRANRAVNTVGLATTSQGTASLSFGYAPADGAYHESKTIRLTNTSSHAITYNLAASSSLVSITPSTVTVRARDSKVVRSPPRCRRTPSRPCRRPTSSSPAQFGELNSLSGAVTATPTSSGPGIYPLRVAYLLVPRGLSDVDTTFVRHPNKPGPNLRGNLKLKNDGVHDGVRRRLRAGPPRPAWRRRPRHRRPGDRRPGDPRLGPHRRR